MKNKTGKTARFLLMIIMTIIVALIMYQKVEDGNRAVLFLLLCYFLWNVWTMRQLTKSRADTVMELERSTALIQCVTELSSHEDVDQAINNLLKIVTAYFQGDRTYIFEMDYEEKLVHNTYEYAAAGVTREIENLRNVPIQIIQECSIFRIWTGKKRRKMPGPMKC